MRDEIATLVHRVISSGLHLKERLEQGERPDFEKEQAKLKGALLTPTEARRWAEFGGDEGLELSKRDHFLGIRYALVCWLDEMFILHSPWGAEWNEQKLEEELYGTNDRAWAFWEQAKRAVARSGSDALETFYLCVMLGFRGDYRGETEKLRAWVSSTQARIAQSQQSEWQTPEEVEPPTNVPPLHGTERFQRMVLTGAVVLLVLLPVAAYFLMTQLG